MFQDPLFWTVVVILAAALVGAFFRGRHRDICLRSFSGYLCTVRLKSGKRAWGNLSVATTGIELTYEADHLDGAQVESSFIIYKSELQTLDVILRFRDELSPEDAARREKTLNRSYHPNLFRRMRRKVRGIFNTIRDSLGEAVNVVAASVVKKAPGGTSAVSRTGTAALESFGNAYDPLLERHIGRRVILEVTLQDKSVVEYAGVFREYSPEFLEVMDIDYQDGERCRETDMIVPRSHGFIRHSGERVAARRSGKTLAQA